MRIFKMLLNCAPAAVGQTPLLFSIVVHRVIFLLVVILVLNLNQRIGGFKIIFYRLGLEVVN